MRARISIPLALAVSMDRRVSRSLHYGGKDPTFLQCPPNSNHTSNDGTACKRETLGDVITYHCGQAIRASAKSCAGKFGIPLNCAKDEFCDGNICTKRDARQNSVQENGAHNPVKLMAAEEALLRCRGKLQINTPTIKEQYAAVASEIVRNSAAGKEKLEGDLYAKLCLGNKK